MHRHFHRRGYHHGNLREALVEAARHLVGHLGPQGFTLVEAARRAGVSPSAPYRHFKDREEVLAALCERGFALFADRLREAAAGAPTPADALRRMGPAYLGFARAEPGLYTAMFGFRPGDAEAGGEGGGGSAAFDILAGAIAAVLPPGAPPARRVALQVWALAHGLALLERAGQMPRGADAPTAEAVLEGGVEALLRLR